VKNVTKIKNVRKTFLHHALRCYMLSTGLGGPVDHRSFCVKFRKFFDPASDEFRC